MSTPESASEATERSHVATRRTLTTERSHVATRRTLATDRSHVATRRTLATDRNPVARSLPLPRVGSGRRASVEARATGLAFPLVLLATLVLLALPAVGPVSAAERGTDTGALVGPQGAPLPWAQRMRWAGEELYFNMEFRGSLAARSALSIGDVQEHEEHGRVIPIQGIAASTGLFATVYPMENDGTTWLDPETGFPVQAIKEIRERQRRRVYDVTYERDRWRGSVRREMDERTSNYRRWLPGDIHDGFSWIYDLRTRDLSVGNAHIFYVYDGWRLSRLTIRVLTHEELFVSSLGTLDVAYFEVLREVLDSHSPVPWAGDLVSLPPVYHGSLEPYSLAHGWISLDERRIPVGVEVNTGLGLFRLIVSRHVPPANLR